MIFLFRTLGTNLKYPLVVGSKMICLGRNKDLCSRRSKYKSYGALRGVRSGGKGLSPGVLWRVETVGLWQCDAMRNSAK